MCMCVQFLCLMGGVCDCCTRLTEGEVGWVLPWDYANVRFMGPSFGLWKLRGRLLIVEVSGKGMKLGGFICFGWVHPQCELGLFVFQSELLVWFYKILSVI